MRGVGDSGGSPPAGRSSPIRGGMAQENPSLLPRIVSLTAELHVCGECVFGKNLDEVTLPCLFQYLHLVPVRKSLNSHNIKSPHAVEDPEEGARARARVKGAAAGPRLLRTEPGRQPRMRLTGAALEFLSPALHGNQSL